MRGTTPIPGSDEDKETKSNQATEELMSEVENDMNDFLNLLGLKSTSTNMNTNAAANDHQTMGSRASSARAMLIMVPKLIVVGSTPMPT